MLFNSLDFGLFFPLVVGLYFIMPDRWRWLLLLVASYIFYMWWNASYALLILISTTIDYVAALQMNKALTKKGKRKWLFLSLGVNLGLLAMFKYLNFATNVVNDLLLGLGLSHTFPYADLLLPVGISFYTFQTLAYTIDVYHEKIRPERHFGKFALYVSFFPQLVAGPIERAGRLLPQIHQKFVFRYQQITDGLKLMAWGFFKKVVIADRLAIYVDMVYGDPGAYEGWPIILAAVFFTFQVYCDFSGYSDIAIGAAQVFGINLVVNFRRPFHAVSMREFWRRWHISLSTWFKDYVYIPLGGNRVHRWRWYYNITIVFLAVGLWHGANWTFVVFGAVNALYLLVGDATLKLRARIFGLEKWPLTNKWINACCTFCLFAFSLIIYRANNMNDAALLIKNMVMIKSEQLWLPIFMNNRYELMLAAVFVVILEIVHLWQRRQPVRDWIRQQPVLLRWTCYLALVLVIIGFGVYEERPFVYFQF